MTFCRPVYITFLFWKSCVLMESISHLVTDTSWRSCTSEGCYGRAEWSLWSPNGAECLQLGQRQYSTAPSNIYQLAHHSPGLCLKISTICYCCRFLWQFLFILIALWNNCVWCVKWCLWSSEVLTMYMLDYSNMIIWNLPADTSCTSLEWLHFDRHKLLDCLQGNWVVTVTLFCCCLMAEPVFLNSMNNEKENIYAN